MRVAPVKSPLQVLSTSGRTAAREEEEGVEERAATTRARPESAGRGMVVGVCGFVVEVDLGDGGSRGLAFTTCWRRQIQGKADATGGEEDEEDVVEVDGQALGVVLSCVCGLVWVFG